MAITTIATPWPTGYSLVNYNGLAAQISKVYENFVVPVGQTWTITSVYSNDQLSYRTDPVTTAAWEIRSGVSSGNGGTLVGSDPRRGHADRPHPDPGYFYDAPPVQITATVAPLVLTAGTYWLSVIPTEPTIFVGNQSYVMTTSGLNSVGTPPGNDGNSFISNNLPSARPGPTTSRRPRRPRSRGPGPGITRWASTGRSRSWSPSPRA